MKEQIHKLQLLEYAESVLSGKKAEEIRYIATKNSVEGECVIWLVEMEDGEEYWLLEGEQPANLYKKSGIYESVERVYEAHIEWMSDAQEQGNVPDRFQLYR